MPSLISLKLAEILIAKRPFFELQEKHNREMEAPETPIGRFPQVWKHRRKLFFRPTMIRAANVLRAVPRVPALATRFYHKKVIDHYENPRNVGSMDKNSPDVGTGIVGAPACGDVMKLQIKIDDETGKVVDCCFKVHSSNVLLTCPMPIFSLFPVVLADLWLWFGNCFLILCHRVGQGKVS
jgi:hypothetical protein